LQGLPSGRRLLQNCLSWTSGALLHCSNTSEVFWPSANGRAVLVADPLSLLVRISVAYRARPTSSWNRAGCPIHRSHSSSTVRNVGSTWVLVSSQSITLPISWSNRSPEYP